MLRTFLHLFSSRTNKSSNLNDTTEWKLFYLKVAHSYWVRLAHFSLAVTSEKSLTIYDVPIVEESYTAAALLQAGVSKSDIELQLKELNIEK